MEKAKTHSKLSNKRAQRPVLSYLPDGWEFAIVTIKPPKGCKNREQSHEARFSWPRHPWAAPASRVHRNTWLCERSSAARTHREAAPSASPHSPGLTWVTEPAGEHQGQAQVPRTWEPLRCLLGHWLQKSVAENQRESCFLKDELFQIRDPASKHKALP